MKASKIARWLLFAALLAGGVLLLIWLLSAGGGNKTANNPSAPASPQDPDPVPEAETTATYTIRYDVPWSTDTHPGTLPPGPHVSPIVIVAHESEGDLFASGSLATDGIEMMAETGATKVLAGEIDDNPSILGSVIGGRIDAPGSSNFELELDQDHPLLSAVSMLAPSPDWFVAVTDINLLEDGQWLDEIKLKMNPYDAGTDSGARFTADDSDTNPAEPIGPPVDDELIDAAGENSFATLTLIKR